MVILMAGNSPDWVQVLTSEVSKFWLTVWVRTPEPLAGTVTAFPQRSKTVEPMVTDTSVSVSAVFEVFSIRTAPASIPPGGPGSTPTKLTFGEPFHGVGVKPAGPPWLFCT